ncbi:phosphatase PAP2 family protein [Tepidamorphus sp. 3E244]|uniref:phosphatase PAP2 family protein n=1 Tax=Tepidamorphus sp. 3E244 TaxID=3385498 RepID=UPI0038FD1962
MSERTDVLHAGADRDGVAGRVWNAFVRWFWRFFRHRVPPEVVGTAVPKFGGLGLGGAFVVLVVASGLSFVFLDPLFFGLFSGIDAQSKVRLLEWAWIGKANMPLYVTGSVALLLMLTSLVTVVERRRVQIAQLASTFGFLFFAIAAPGGMAAALKQIIGRARPFMSPQTGYWDFQPLGGFSYASLPSGDACNAFALATAFGLLFPKTRFVMFPYAAIVAVGRMAGDRHYFTDVMLGAILGMAGAYWVALWCARRRHVFNIVDGKLRPRGYRVLRRPGTA